MASSGQLWVASGLGIILKFVEQGKLRPVHDRTLPLAEADLAVAVGEPAMARQQEVGAD